VDADTAPVTSQVRPAMPFPLPPAPWPYGPARPGVATAAAWLGRVTAAGTALVALMAAASGPSAAWAAIPVRWRPPLWSSALDT
jgi:hypothetical protein